MKEYEHGETELRRENKMPQKMPPLPGRCIGSVSPMQCPKCDSVIAASQAILLGDDEWEATICTGCGHVHNRVKL